MSIWQRLVLKVNGTLAANQGVLNLKAGTNVTLTPAANGDLTIDASGGGGLPSGSGNEVIATPADGSSGTSALRVLVPADVAGALDPHTGDATPQLGNSTYHAPEVHGDSVHMYQQLRSHGSRSVHRRTFSDTDAIITLFGGTLDDTLAQIGTLTAPRTILINDAGVQGAQFTVCDESGSCDAMNTLTLDATPTLMNGNPTLVLNAAYASVTLEWGGSAWTIRSKV